jgi:hypothetical protein
MPDPAVTTDATPDQEQVVSAAAEAGNSVTAALQDVAQSLRDIQAELVRFRKMTVRLIVGSLICCALAAAWLWWSARSLQSNIGGGDLNKLLKDLTKDLGTP